MVWSAFVGTPSHELGVRRHDQPDSSYRTLAREAAFDAVAAVRSANRHLGSGVLIAPGWVLTAAHVVSARVGGNTSTFGAESVVVRFETRDVRVAEIIIHEDYWPDTAARSADVLARKAIDAALLRLSTPVAQVRPVQRLSGLPLQGALATFVGFGTSGTALSIVSAPEASGTKRAGTNVIDQIGGRVESRTIPPYLLVSDFDAPGMPELNRTGASTPTELEYMPVGGDSGGGIFVRAEDGWRLAGLFATATINDNDGDARRGIYGSLAYSTSVGILGPWIDKTLALRPQTR